MSEVFLFNISIPKGNSECTLHLSSILAHVQHAHTMVVQILSMRVFYGTLSSIFNICWCLLPMALLSSDRS